jgi:hypothetical protein
MQENNFEKSMERRTNVLASAVRVKAMMHCSAQELHTSASAFGVRKPPRIDLT